MLLFHTIYIYCPWKKKKGKKKSKKEEWSPIALRDSVLMSLGIVSPAVPSRRPHQAAVAPLMITLTGGGGGDGGGGATTAAAPLPCSPAPHHQPGSDQLSLGPARSVALMGRH